MEAKRLPSAYEREELVAMIRDYGLIGVLDGIAVACNLQHLQHLGDEDQREADVWARRERLALDASELVQVIAQQHKLRL